MAIEAAPEQPSREAVYVYSEKQAGPNSLMLRSEPLLLSTGYARLVGVVSGSARPADGDRPIALIELGGRGLTAAVGEVVDGFTVDHIDQEVVYLSKEK
ncbi:MAG: hypothetical protein WCW67_00640 [Candidatus Margulisiibacteriota bacterium]